MLGSRDGFVNPDNIARHINGLVADVTPENVSQTTGISKAKIEEVAALYGQAKTHFIGWT